MKITTIHHPGLLEKKQQINNSMSLLERKRVAAYVRVSTLTEEQELSYDAQCEYYKALFKDNPKHILIGVYADHGISGTFASKRPGFMDLIRDCKHGRIDEVYTKSISRFARNFVECIDYVKQLKDLGIVIYFEKEGFSTLDKNIEILLSLISIIAQEEANSISLNVSLAHEYRNLKGDPIRKVPYGYIKDNYTTNGIHMWHIKEDEALYIRLIYSLFLNNKSYKEIIYELNKDNKRIWTKSSIIYTLTSEIYVGDIITSKSYTVDYLKKIRKMNNGEKKQCYLKDHHPAIISREDYLQVAMKMKRSLPLCMQTH